MYTLDSFNVLTVKRGSKVGDMKMDKRGCRVVVQSQRDIVDYRPGERVGIISRLRGSSKREWHSYTRQ